MASKTRLVTAALAGVLGVAVTGAVAFAAFEPGAATTTTATGVPPSAASAQAERERPRQRIKEVLDQLVQKGTITQAQEDAILQALKAAAPKARDGEPRRVVMDILKVSADYIGLPKDQLRDQLKAGKSLGQIADSVGGGKSRAGLIQNDVTVLGAQIDRAVADGKITKEQADKLRAHLTERVTKFVDHVAGPKKPKT